ncbi:MAG: YggS family pyridoxal phosphate-dependent enzyme [Eubacteriales bacterium]|nr:YggS family pyridoxal phosphate-dependent enzyme [Eubacteriales bacterium]
MEATNAKEGETALKPALLADLPPETLKRNVGEILANLAKNTYENSTPAKLIAVTKTVSPTVINRLHALEIRDIAENRAQVALPKLPHIETDFRLHWIGRLQTNKVKDIIDKVCLLHSLDRPALAEEAERRAEQHGRVLPALVQVNIACEPQKAGFSVEEVRPFLRRMKDYHCLQVCGLMSIMPLDADEEALTGWFRGMRELFEQLRGEAMEGVEMRELSMGMSHDYVLAARQGATMVRVGTALYRA